jgi:hypothetical protein
LVGFHHFIGLPLLEEEYLIEIPSHGPIIMTAQLKQFYFFWQALYPMLETKLSFKIFKSRTSSKLIFPGHYIATNGTALNKKHSENKYRVT